MKAMKLSTCVVAFGFLTHLVIIEAKRPYNSGLAHDQWIQSVAEEGKDIGWFKSIWNNILWKLGYRSLNDHNNDSMVSRLFQGFPPRPKRLKETGEKVPRLMQCTGKRQDPKPYNSLTLSLTWTTGHCFQNEDCISKLPEIFALHGLWPSRRKCCTDNISYLNGDVIYKGKTAKYFSAVQDIVKDRMVSLFNARLSTLALFQQYEWTKHGTCAVGSNPSLNDPISYFDKMMQLDRLIGGSSILARARVGVQPSTPVETSKIERVVKSTVNNKRIQMRCRQFAGDKPKQTLYLMHEIRVCFNSSNIVPIDCSSEFDDKSKCGTEVYLKF